ncbi:MAG: WbqC family protein [Candidatus Omnitrophota bacterium]|nr:WbqC family protein [Candidatus Omnitrophota bacterium]
MSTNKIIITQSDYIPWKGYFDSIHMADVVVLYDDAQYTRRDWRNRNKIKTANGVKWLTIPVHVKEKYHQKINEVRISDPEWKEKHWKSLAGCYRKARYFEEYGPILEALYRNCTFELLSEINFTFLRAICKLLNIDTAFKWSGEFPVTGDKSERLLRICRELNATHYLTGPAAKDYLNTDVFRSEGIEVEWLDYSGYPEYTQLHPPFEHGVTILDLIFNEGPNAAKYMKTFS